MFVLGGKVFFWETCTATLPSPDDPDGTIEQRFKLRFEALPRDEARRLDEEWTALEDDEKAGRRWYLLERTVVDWADVVDAAGQPVPFSVDLLHQALQLPWFPAAAYAGYVRGMTEGRAKN
jgi:hypothetical protein